MRLIGKFIVASMVFLVLGVGFFFYIIRTLPTADEITQRQTIESTKIYDRTGETLLYEIHGEEKRTTIPFEQIPDVMKEATISIEDSSFYSHPAFDWRGILRALFVDITTGTISQGASTITQQLAKKAFLSSEKTITRKIKELALAWKLENTYTKDQILNLYLNQIPYGGNAYGVEAASQTYFNHNAEKLSLGESAMLAALTQAPSYYSPWGSHTDELEDRRKLVLKRMLDLGYIDQAQYDSASTNKPKVVSQPTSSIRAPHFVFYVQDYLREKYGEDILEAGGLKVITTLDWGSQQTAELAVENGVKRNSELYGGENAAMVVEDPTTGQILAMVGSKDYFADPVPNGCTPGKNCKFEGNFNVATQGQRQPGSALKPFVYITFLQQGFLPETILWDVPTEFAAGRSDCPVDVNFNNDNTKCYHPQNFDGKFRGPMMAKEALAQSINVPAVKALYLAGLKNVLDNLSAFGITTLNDPDRFGLSLTLGGGEVKLTELVGAYSVLANDGAYHKQAVVLKAEDKNGNILEEYQDNSKKVIDANYPRLINDILSDVDLRAPLYSASLGLTLVPGHQVALKTGTTNDYKDAWTIGFTPDLTVGVWVGNNNQKPLTSKGGSVLAAVPIWHEFMAKALANRPLVTFPKPDPESSSNPIVRGELVQGEYHEILYYLDRVNDSQFNNWEEGVKKWLLTNKVDVNKFKTTTSAPVVGTAPNAPAGDMGVTINSPSNGSFITDTIDVSADAYSNNKITKLEIYLNEKLIDSKVNDLGQSYKYITSLKPNNLELQNILVIRVTDESGIQSSKQVIVYKNP